ncbi:MAG: helix-turn-helix domain-containing protein [Nanoarchaeota archaeon]
MPDDSFILLNLKEEKAKKLAQAISNSTARKILDYMTDKKDTTASQIAKELSIPLSTVQYNLQHLLEARLAVSDEYHYSEKGKAVDHYRLANKFVVIAPQESGIDSIKKKLRGILPVALISVGMSAILYILGSINVFSANTMVAHQIEADTTEAVRTMVAKTAPPAPQTSLLDISVLQNAALWFLIGAIFAIGLSLLLDAARRKRKK